MRRTSRSWISKASPRGKRGPHCKAGKCLELQERWNQASEVYREALRRWQTSDSAHQLQARLNWAEKQLVRR